MPDRDLDRPMRIRLIVLAVTTAVILSVVNFQIAKKERIVARGETVLLRLAPRDPRSLLQGDYMALRYAMAQQVADAAKRLQVSDGRIVVELGDNGEATFVAIYDGGPLTDARQLLRFRRRGDSVRLASDAYFFEEGEWDTYDSARFGELRVSDTGEAVLVGLRAADFSVLGRALL